MATRIVLMVLSETEVVFRKVSVLTTTMLDLPVMTMMLTEMTAILLTERI